MSGAHSDEEMGTRPNTTLPDPPSEGWMSRVVRMLSGNRDQDEDDDCNMPPVQDEKPPSDDLSVFRRLTGIDSSPTHKASKKRHRHRPANNNGIYQHVFDEEKAAKRKYIIFSRLINGCLGLQIVVAAALTALGAGNGPHAVVTVFGAVNTVIAGFLTYLKGSGLPNQAKYFHSEWSKLREYIEQRERDFGCENNKRNVEVEIKKVEDWYNRIRAEIEANTTDGYTPMSKAVDKRLEGRHTSNESSVTEPGVEAGKTS
jgi:SMODS and SLOG-associating 2TM effector domain